MNPLSIDVKNIITDETDLVFGADLFIGKEPDAPSGCITIYDTGGPAQNAMFAYDESTIQIRSRGADYQTAWSRLNEVRKVLQSSRVLELSDGVNLVGIWLSSNIMFLTTDKLDRCVFTCNFRAIRELSSEHSGHRQSFIV